MVYEIFKKLSVESLYVPVEYTENEEESGRIGCYEKVAYSTKYITNSMVNKRNMISMLVNSFGNSIDFSLVCGEKDIAYMVIVRNGLRNRIMYNPNIKNLKLIKMVDVLYIPPFIHIGVRAYNGDFDEYMHKLINATISGEYNSVTDKFLK